MQEASDGNLGHVSAENRWVRVFISSTFKDMDAEREELVKFVFPELRKRCRKRKVEFDGVDLRWGITDEQAAEGKVLPICLREIEGCRPYFIGLLGERYGWVPKGIDKELLALQPWLDKHKEKSVTELEILHGVLESPKMKGLAYFYFRDKSASDAIEKLLSKDPRYIQEPDASRFKLETLKKRIRNKGYPFRDDYPDAKTLGKMVLEDLWSAIDKRYPLEEVPSALEQRRSEHEAFAALRRKVYIEDDTCIQDLNDYVISSHKLPLVLLGESGSGKSALMANWAEQYKKNHPEVFMISYFIGGASDSADYVNMLRQIMEGIKEKYDIATKDREGDALSFIVAGDEGHIPTDPQKVVEAFPRWLVRASARGTFVLILDGLNQLEDRDNALGLGWLPHDFPENVRLILSTLPGRTLDALKKRDYPQLQVRPLESDKKRKFIIKYLKQYRKELSLPQIEKIIKAGQVSNPLYLRTLLEELRIFGVYEELDKKIEHYLKAQSIEGLFNLVLERLENDYETDKKGLVKDVTTLIWAARKGLSETELLEILGTQDSPMPRAYWSPLYLSLEESFVSRSGLLSFFHDFLRKAVEERYVSTGIKKEAAHLRIADYFDSQEISDRKVDELPWQLNATGKLERLKDCITDIEIFEKLYDVFVTNNDLMNYWLVMGDRYDIVVEYNSALEKYEPTVRFERTYLKMLEKVAGFFKLNGNHKGAEPLYKKILVLKLNLFGELHPETARCFQDMSEHYLTTGNLSYAGICCQKAYFALRKLYDGDHPAKITTLGTMAEIFRLEGKIDDAESACRMAIGISERVFGKQHFRTSVTLNNLALLLADKGEYEEAESLYRRVLEILEKVLGPDNYYIGTVLNNLGLVLAAKGNYGEAEAFYRRGLELNEKLCGPEHPKTALILYNLAMLRYSKKDIQDAEHLFRRSLRIRQNTLGNKHQETFNNQHNLAKLLKEKGDYAEAELLFKSALETGEALLGNKHPAIISTLHDLCALFCKKGDYEQAIGYLRRLVMINKETLGPDHAETIQCMNSLSVYLCLQGYYKDAEPLLEEILEIRMKKLGPEAPDTISSYDALADLLVLAQKYGRALELIKKVLATKEKVMGPQDPSTERTRKLMATMQSIENKNY